MFFQIPTTLHCRPNAFLRGTTNGIAIARQRSFEMGSEAGGKDLGPDDKRLECDNETKTGGKTVSIVNKMLSRLLSLFAS